MTWRETPPRGWAALAANTAAVLYGVWFLAWAPFGSTGVDLLLASQSLLVGTLVWVLLHRQCKRGDARAGQWGAAVVTAFALWAVIGGFSLSFGVFPAACMLVLAALLTPAGHAQAAP